MIDEVSKVVVWLIRAGATFRLCYCLFKLISADDAVMYKKRAKNVIVFYIIAESVWLIKSMILYYFK